MKKTMTEIRELCEFLTDHSPSDDNVPLNRKIMTGIIKNMKLILLLVISIMGKKLWSFLNGNHWIFRLPFPLEYEDFQGSNADEISYFMGNQKSISIEFKDEDSLAYNWYETPLSMSLYQRPIPCKVQDNYFRKHPVIYLLYGISRYKTEQEVFANFGESSNAFDKMKSKVPSTYCKNFYSTKDSDYSYMEKRRWDNPNVGDSTLIAQDLNEFIWIGTEGKVMRDVYSSVSVEGQVKQVYDFKDEQGIVNEKVIKHYLCTEKGPEKVYIPVTLWIKSGVSKDYILPLPHPDGQVLLHRDKISSADYVVICPNIEIADRLERENEYSNVVFTAFLCDTGAFQQVDFSPLEEKHVILLAVNHSGKDAEMCILETQSFYAYLKKNQRKIGYQDLSVVQSAVAYAPECREFNSIAQYENLCLTHTKPRVIDGSTIVFEDLLVDDSSFQDHCKQAEKIIEEMNHPCMPFWYKKENSITETPVADVEADYAEREIVRGVIARGEICYINATSGTGKTSFTLALCAFIINPSERPAEFLTERCWTRGKIKGYVCYKILCFDCDNSEAFRKTREKDFIAPYLPEDKEKRKICKGNLIIKNMATDMTDYSDSDNFGKLCKLIDDAANEGIQGQPVDILVIDTLWAFMHEQEKDSEIFRNLKNKYPNMAIVVLHHLNKNGTIKGSSTKSYPAATEIILSREEEGVTLKTPFKISFGDKHRLIKTEMELKPFYAKLNEQNHFVVVNPTNTEAEMVKNIKEGYGLSNEGLAERLNMGLSKVKSLLKEAGNKKV